MICPVSWRARGRDTVRDSLSFPSIENVTVMLSFAQGPGVTIISKCSHEQKCLEVLQVVSGIASIVCLYNSGETTCMEKSAIPIRIYRHKENARARAELTRYSACLSALESSHFCQILLSTISVNYIWSVCFFFSCQSINYGLNGML